MKKLITKESQLKRLENAGINNQRIFQMVDEENEIDKVVKMVNKYIYLQKKLNDLDTYCTNRRLKYRLSHYFENIDTLNLKKIKELNSNILLFEREKKSEKKKTRKRLKKENNIAKEIERIKKAELKKLSEELTSTSIRTVSGGLPGQGKRS